MAKVTLQVEIELELSESTDELLDTAGREVIAGINGSVDQNQNVEDIVVTAIDATEVTVKKTNLLPDEELATLGQ